eukprot:scaffold119475_cov63-Phaeocystis_antarctica.AAC.1
MNTTLINPFPATGDGRRRFLARGAWDFSFRLPPSRNPFLRGLGDTGPAKRSGGGGGTTSGRRRAPRDQSQTHTSSLLSGQQQRGRLHRLRCGGGNPGLGVKGVCKKQAPVLRCASIAKLDRGTC